MHLSILVLKGHCMKSFHMGIVRYKTFALQKVVHKYALFSVSALLFILCFVFVDTIFLYSDDVFSLLVDFSPYFFVHPQL